jgi:serine/threonine-protein kinase
MLLQVDAACDRFEADWRASRRPRIEDYLPSVSGPLHDAVLRSLLQLECELSGMDIAQLAGAFRNRFPADVAIVDALACLSAPAIRVILTVTDGPNTGKSFAFDRRDNFIVGRGRGVHFQPDKEDRYFSRFHFFIEINPPLCRLTDLNSRNGTRLNGQKVGSCTLKDGDAIRAGRTELAVRIERTQVEHTIDWGDPEGLVPAFPGYRIERELGRGGMGVVYLATREADGVEVAVKSVTPQGAVTRRNVDRFLREASILMRLDHPNIVRFRDLGAAGGKLFFTMDYVPGTDAQRLLQDRGKWSLRSAVRVIREVLNGLAYAHEAGFVHRDIKPANILLGRGQTGYSVKLADFGLARVYEASQISGLSHEGEFGGTLRFMPPEQMTDYRNVTPASDQFSAAATLYHLLTGHFIHELDARKHVPVVSVLDGQAVPIRDRRPELPEEFANALHRALERDPKARFESVGEFARALESYSR